MFRSKATSTFQLLRITTASRQALSKAADGRMCWVRTGQDLGDSATYIVRLESKKEQSVNTKPTIAHQCRRRKKSQKEAERVAEQKGSLGVADLKASGRLCV